ncbi:MAG: 4Fe-4S dicluster domain-containing protein [Saprospiraceae bacterium]
MSQEVTDTEKYRDKIATVDEHGNRNWIYPKKPVGKFYEYRKYASYVLLLFLFGMPFIKIGGEPILLFNILERRFIVFGINFGPQDLHLLVFGMLIFIIFIALFTVVFGRLFCGWVCPQTIFMEMVYRRIEYFIEGDANAQKRLNRSAWTAEKTFKKVTKQFIFFCIAVLIANTFLSYIIGVDQVYQIITEPVSQHMSGFISMIVFSFAFYFVFSVMREQVCVTICPYGRLQGVLLDKDSIAVYYDFDRGEPRGRMKKTKPAKKKPAACDNPCAACRAGAECKDDKKKIAAENPITAIQKELGDCIDCNLCVKVCPTGIDIRDGIQLECVNCTACMDACDEVMEKIDRPLGLIRYDSYNGIIEKRKKIWTPRVMAYTAVLSALILLEVFLLVNRADVEVLFLRTPGMLFQKTEQGDISNLYNYQIVNKTKEAMPLEFRLENVEGEIRFVGNPPSATEDGLTEGAVFIQIDPNDLQGKSTSLIIGVYSEGREIDKVKTKFLGPIK